MEYKNILIVKLSAIGDVIHALPVARAIKSNQPDIRVTWVVERPAMDLLTNNPDIDEIILFEKPKYKSVSGLLEHGPAFANLLRSRRFDLVLDLQGLFKSAAIAWLSGAPRRIGYCDMREMSQYISRPACGPNRNGHVVDRYLDVARVLGCQLPEVSFPIHITHEEAIQAGEIAAANGLDIGKPFAVLAPGTNWPTKCWPSGHYSKLAGGLEQYSLTPVLIGGGGDSGLARKIMFETKAPVVDLTGKTSLKQLAFIIKNARIFVGGDTGPMHLAVAVNTPTIAMFGPSNPDRNGPYNGASKVLISKAECVRCQKRRCEQNCMASISVEDVLQAVYDLIGTSIKA